MTIVRFRGLTRASLPAREYPRDQGFLRKTDRVVWHRDSKKKGSRHAL